MGVVVAVVVYDVGGMGGSPTEPAAMFFVTLPWAAAVGLLLTG